MTTTDPNDAVHEKLLAVYDALYRHNGFGEMAVEVRILKKFQKEVIIKSGKQYRFVVDWMNAARPAHGQPPPGSDARGEPAGKPEPAHPAADEASVNDGQAAHA
jgi:hypothetical protein